MAHRINTGRQAIAAMQRNCNYKPSGSIAQHVLDATVEYTSSKPVTLVRANQPMLVGQVVVQNGKQYFLVASSKFAGRYYVVTNNAGQWQCSSKDEATSRMVIGKARAYRAELVAAKAEKVNMQRLTDLKIGDAYEQMNKQVVSLVA